MENNKYMNFNNIIKNKTFKIFDLPMTVEGFERLSDEVKNSNYKLPQIYIHISVDDILTNEILRIGVGKNGILDRWINSSNGHKSTFYWSIGESKKYGKNAARYPNYLLFFAEIFSLKTNLIIINCDSEEEMKQMEKDLIEYFNPIWEKYKPIIRIYLKQNKDVKDLVTQYGNAKKIVNKNIKDLPTIKDFHSNHIWVVN